MKDFTKSHEYRKNRCYCCGRDLRQPYEERKKQFPLIGCQKCDNLIEKYPYIKYIKVEPPSSD